MSSVTTVAGLGSSRFEGSRASCRSLDVLDYVLFLPGIWLACGLSISLRIIGPAFIVVPTGTCLLYAVLRKTSPPRLLTTYVAYCILAGVLSAEQIFPTSWQVHFLREAIVRQLVPLLGFWAVAWGSKAYFRNRLVHGDVFYGAPLAIVLGLIVATGVMYQQGLGYEGDRSFYAVVTLSGAFLNNTFIAFFFVTGAIFLTRDWRRYTGLLTVLAIAVTSHFSQFKVFTAIILASLFGFAGRKAAIAIMVVLPVLYAAGMSNIPEAMRLDPNDGLRLVLMRDAFSSVADTQGIGIGYGKESVRWRYRFPGLPDFTFLPDANSMTHQEMLEALSRGVHNSFAQALLRTGFPGCLLLLSAFLAAFPPSSLRRDVRNHAATVFAMLFIASFVDTALETPAQVVGFGFCYGYLLALKAEARLRAHRYGPFESPALAAAIAVRP
jgi:hypothetical protein